MYHFALENNVLNFSTVFLEAERLKAGRFHGYLEFLQHYKSAFLLSFIESRFDGYITPAVKAKLALQYPQHEKLVTALISASGESLENVCWFLNKYQNLGQATSCFRGFLNHLIQILLKDAD